MRLETFTEAKLAQITCPQGKQAASGMIKPGVSGDVVKAKLNNTPDRLVATYRRHDYFEEKRTALQRWADHLERPVEPRGQVIQFPGVAAA